jgi:hypothetical protein
MEKTGGLSKLCLIAPIGSARDPRAAEEGEVLNLGGGEGVYPLKGQVLTHSQGQKTHLNLQP